MSGLLAVHSPRRMEGNLSNNLNMAHNGCFHATVETFLLAAGLYAVVRIPLVPSILDSSAKSVYSNCRPWSVRMIEGTPNRAAHPE